MKKKIILGLDPGTRITGYGVLEGPKPNPIDYGCIRLQGEMESAKKYYLLYTSIEKLLITYEPTSVAIESPFMYKNAQTALKLGMAKGAALIACAKHQIPVFEYAPTKAKIAVVGKGSASKEQVQRMIKALLNLSELPTPFDASDALAIAYCHLGNCHV